MTRRLSPANLGRWSGTHPWLAITLWMAFVLAAVFALAATGSKQLQNGAVGESARGNAIMFDHQVGFSQPVYGYLHSSTLVASSESFRSAIGEVASGMRAALHSRTAVRVAPGRHSALISASGDGQYDGPSLERSLAAVATRHPGVTAQLVGPGSGGKSDLHRAEELSVPVTLLVLLLAFGGLVAAIVPVLLAATAVVAAFGLLGPISQVFPLDNSVKTIVLLIGMAVGVDYALFYVIRSREERKRGLPAHEALERTARTSGRTVVIAGLTVIAAMAGQYAIGSSIFNGIASGTIAVVACAVVGSVTVLPAMLELVGSKIDRGRIPFLPTLKVGTAESKLWPRITEHVLRRPILALTMAAALLVALAIPAIGLHVAKPSSDALSAQTASAARQMTAAFPGTSAPAIVTGTFSGSRSRVTRALDDLERMASTRGIAHRPFAVNFSQDGQAFALALPLTGLGDNAASRNAVEELRRHLIPQTLGAIPGVHTAVTGDTAQGVDFTNQMKAGMPYVIGFVLALAFLLLLTSFRSIVVPLKAIALNLLSVAASYGVLVLVFQHHWAESLFGFHSDGTIISWLPLFLFVILFGLSMDYHVFILSRIREAVDGGMTTDDAVRHGIARTAGVVTAAAMVMVAVFSLFGTSHSLDLKEAGVGLAVAVLLDATVVRGVLLPASMKVLGDWNWYLPRSLTWLPGLDHEPPLQAEPVPAAD